MFNKHNNGNRLQAATRVVASDSDFTKRLPELLLDWYKGAAMLDEYDVDPEANAAVLAGMSDDEYEELAGWMVRFRDTLGHVDRQLWRCINVPPDLVDRDEDDEIPSVVHMTPGKNALCSWSDSKQSCLDFWKLLKQKDRVELDSVAFIVTHEMPAEAQCISNDQTRKLCDYALRNAPSTQWKALRQLMDNPIIVSQREVVCCVPQTLNMEVVKVLKDGV